MTLLRFASVSQFELITVTQCMPQWENCGYDPESMPAPLPPWWHLHPGVGWFIVVFGLVGVLVPLIREKISKREKAVWTCVLVVFAVLELRTIHYDSIEHEATEKHDRCVELDSFKTIAEGVKQELANSTQILDLEKQGRVPSMSPQLGQSLIKKWGQLSQLHTKSVEGAVASPEHPAQLQQGRRAVNAETLGVALKTGEPASATIIDDGTNEAGNLANQLVIGLGFAGWQAGGDNIKIGDPAFFPDSLTVEVSAIPASSADHSTQEAKGLIAALEKQGIEATLRFTNLAFPPNFMRIKVAGK
jgi:hypothetical protein